MCNNVDFGGICLSISYNNSRNQSSPAGFDIRGMIIHLFIHKVIKTSLVSGFIVVADQFN